MASVENGAVLRQVGRLFGPGTVAGMTESELLDRFVARRDGAAFEALLSRHGPAVLGVCRRLLDDPNDVDDAFQATFLVLVRKAGTLRDPPMVGNWLHGVARRVSLRARARAARRRSVEGTGVDRGEDFPARPPGSSELRDLLDEELARLPERDRAAIVLSDLEGLPNEEAARALGLKAVAFRSRLHRARKRLGDRLRRRGLAPGAGLPAIPAASVSPTLAEATVAAALRFGAGTAAGLIPAPILSLTHEVLRTMLLSQWKVAATVLVAAGLVTSSVGVQAQEPTPPQTTPSPADSDRLREVERKLDRVLNALERPGPPPGLPGQLGGMRDTYTASPVDPTRRFPPNDPFSPPLPPGNTPTRSDRAPTALDRMSVVDRTPAALDRLTVVERRVGEMEQRLRQLEQRLDRLEPRGRVESRTPADLSPATEVRADPFRPSATPAFPDARPTTTAVPAATPK